MLKQRGRCLSCLALLLAGCGAGIPENERVVYPTSGVVTYEGTPLPDATVVLHPINPFDDGKPVYVPRGRAAADGSFKLSTYRLGDGAPVGEYVVTVSWMGPLDGLDEDEEDLLPELLPNRYTDPRISGIRVTIVEGTNELPEIVISEQG